MERITRALERAYEERESRHQTKAGAVSTAPLRPVVQAAAEPAVELTDTAIFRPPTIEFDAAAREAARVLPPGAGGPHGGAYKMLRTQALRRLDQLGGNTLGVLSAVSGEGKTLTAINLAIAIAADPAHTVLLVDLDLRNPGIARHFGYQPEVGVEQCIEDRRPLREAMFKVAGYERLTIVAARARCEHSSELLASMRIADLVNEVRSRYANRTILFDLPPVLQADDALAFAPQLQAGLLVIGAGRTRRDDVSRTLRLLKDLPFVGTVLNGSRDKNDNCY